METLIPTCAAPGCFNSLEHNRGDARYCTARCRLRAHREQEREDHAHPHRNTPQYKQMRDMWPEYEGHRWASDSGDEDGVWDLRIRDSRFEYGTAY